SRIAFIFGLSFSIFARYCLTLISTLISPLHFFYFFLLIHNALYKFIKIKRLLNLIIKISKLIINISLRVKNLNTHFLSRTVINQNNLSIDFIHFTIYLDLI